MLCRSFSNQPQFFRRKAWERPQAFFLAKDDAAAAPGLVRLGLRRELKRIGREPSLKKQFGDENSGTSSRFPVGLFGDNYSCP